MPIIRSSVEADVPAITAIYGHHVRHGTGTFELDPPSLVDMAARRTEVLQRRLPYLVAQREGVVIGYAYCNWFRPRPAYRFTAEDSVYLAPQAQGQGIGRALLAELLTRAGHAGLRKIVAVIGDSANLGSIRLHEAMGFSPVGVFSAVGWKFERWLDIVLMELAIGLADRTQPEDLVDPA